jgi:hypothetical protein
MEMKFDPNAKVKQGDLSESAFETKAPTNNINVKVGYKREEHAAETQDGKFGYLEPKKIKNQVQPSLFAMADERDY